MANKLLFCNWTSLAILDSSPTITLEFQSWIVLKNTIKTTVKQLPGKFAKLVKLRTVSEELILISLLINSFDIIIWTKSSVRSCQSSSFLLHCVHFLTISDDNFTQDYWLFHQINIVLWLIQSTLSFEKWEIHAFFSGSDAKHGRFWKPCKLTYLLAEVQMCWVTF